jgi:hypothetical protein
LVLALENAGGAIQYQLLDLILVEGDVEEGHFVDVTIEGLCNFKS